MLKKIVIRPARRCQVLRHNWGRLTWFASAALGNTDKLTVGLCELKPGCANPAHRHPNCEEVMVLLAGTIRHTAGPGREKLMRPGDTATTPRGILHQARNIGRTTARLAVSFSSAHRRVVGE
jgi:quercetin dioxygenase-like cupin family protein